MTEPSHADDAERAEIRERALAHLVPLDEVGPAARADIDDMVAKARARGLLPPTTAA